MVFHGDLTSLPSSERRMPVDSKASGKISWCESSNCVSLGCTKADSPSPRNGSEHPVPQVGSRAIPRVLQTGDGECLNHGSMMGLSTLARMARSGGFDIGAETGNPVESPAILRTGMRPTGNFEKGFKPGMATF